MIMLIAEFRNWIVTDNGSDNISISPGPWVLGFCIFVSVLIDNIVHEIPSVLIILCPNQPISIKNFNMIVFTPNPRTLRPNHAGDTV